MSMRTLSMRPLRLLALAALAAGVVLLAQALGSAPAHADQPPPGVGPQAIVVPGQLSITTNKSYYYVGEWAQICYKVPAPGYIQITDHQGFNVKTLLSGYDNGTGDCFWGQVTPPTGYECLKITYWFPYGGATQQQTCFSVLPFYPFPY